MICGGCSADIRLPRKGQRLIPWQAMAFCSERCLKNFVFRQSPLSATDLEMAGITRGPRDWGSANCHSTFLGISFRSWFECSVAEHLVKHWHTQIFYEPHALPLDATHNYVPDFWLPEFGVWLEVKGEWRMGGRNKFAKALSILGSDRLLLIPDNYKPWFHKWRKKP